MDDERSDLDSFFGAATAEPPAAERPDLDSFFQDASTQDDSKGSLRGDIYGMLQQHDRLSPAVERNVADPESGFSGTISKFGQNLVGRTAEVAAYTGGLIKEKFGFEGPGSETRVLNDLIEGGGDLIKARDAALEGGATRRVLDQIIGRMEKAGVTDGMKMMDEIRDSIRENQWNPSSNDTTRVLSDGTLRVNPKFLGERDGQAGITAINASQVSPAEKEREIERFKAGRKEVASQMDARTKSYDADYRQHAAEMKAAGITDPEKVFFSWDGLDRNFLEANYDYLRDIVAETGRGLYRQGAGVAAGLAQLSIVNHAAADKVSAGLARSIIESSKKSDYVEGMASVRGETGAILSPAKSMAVSVGQMAPMFVGGGLGRAVTASAEGVAAKLVGSAIATGSVTGTAFGQGYGSIMETALRTADQKAEAQGRQPTDQELTQTLHDFQGAAIFNGVQTAILSKLLPEGHEALAKEGFKAAGSMTAKELLDAFKSSRGAGASISATLQSLRPELTEFAKASLASIKSGAKDEFIEEGINQSLEGIATILSGADPNKTFDEVGQEAWQGAWQGSLIGAGMAGVSNLGSGFEVGFSGNKALADQVATPESVAASGLPETAQALAESSPIPVSQAAQKPTSAQPEAVPGKLPIDGISEGVDVPAMSGAGVAEAIFGKPAAGGQYRAGLKPEDFSVGEKVVEDPSSILNGTRPVLYKGQPTDRAYNPATRQFVPVPLSMQEEPELLHRGRSLTEAKPKEMVQPAPEDKLGSLPTAPAVDELDEIDLSPGPVEAASTQENQPGKSSIQPTESAAQPSKSDEPNPQGQSGSEGQPSSPLPVRQVPIDSEASPQSVPPGVDTETAPAPQAQAEAAVGNESRIAELEAELKNASPSEYQDIAQEIETLRSQLGASAAPAAPSRQEAHNFSLPHADLESAITTGRSVKNLTEHMDSAPPGADAKTKPGQARLIDSTLPVGSMVTGVDGDNVLSRRVVAMTEPLPNGGVRHHLRRIQDSPSSAAVYEPNPGITGRAVKLAREIAGNPDPSSHHDGMATLVRQQFASIASNAFAASRVTFTNEGDPMSSTGSGIRVNTAALTQKFQQSLAKAGDNALARAMASRDMAQYVALSAYHEIYHDVVRQELSEDTAAGKDLANQMRVMAELAITPGVLRDTFLKSARFRLLSESSANGRMDLTDDQILDYLSGKEVEGVSLTKSQQQHELWAIGHEFLDEFHTALETGRDIHEFERSMDRMASSFAGGKNASKAATWAVRLTELANRAMDAIRRFLGAHRLLKQLPPQLLEMHRRAEQLMRDGGFKAPDVHDVKVKAIRQLRDGLGHVVTASRFQTASDRELKSSLSTAVSRIQSLRNDPKFKPVGIDAVSGRLVPNRRLKAEESAMLSPLLEALNSPGRTEVYLRTQAIASDLRLVLFPLNSNRTIGSSSKVVDTFDPERLKDDTEAIRQGLEKHLASAAGASDAASLIQALNRSIDYEVPQGPPALMPEDLMSYFMRGDGSSDIQMRVLATKAEESRAAMSDFLHQESLLNGGARMSDPLPGEDSYEEYNRLWNAFQGAQEAFQEAVDNLIDQGSRSDASGLEQATAAHLSKLAADHHNSFQAALRDLDMRQRRNRPLGDVSDLAARAREHPEWVRDLVSRAGMDSFKVMDSLRRYSDTMSAVGRLASYPAELEYLVSGGPVPASMRTADTGWTNLNATPASLSDLPSADLVRVARPMAGDQTTQARMVVEAMGADLPSGTDAAEAALFSQGRGGSQPVFSEGKLHSSIYTPIINRLAFRISEAANNAYRLFGLEPGDPVGGDWRERDSKVWRNTLALTKPLARNLGDAALRGEISGLTERSAGFPLKLVEGDNRTELEFNDWVIELPDMVLENENGFRDFPELVADGTIGAQLAPMVAFMEAMDGQDATTSRPVLEHEGGITPAGLAYQALVPKLIEFLALSRGVNGKTDYASAILSPMTSGAESLKAAWLSVAPGLEYSPAFAHSRSELAKNHDVLARKFWELRRMAKQVNTIYRSSTSLLNSRRLSRLQQDAKAGLPQDQRFPLNPQLLNHLEFGSAFRANRLRKTNDESPGGPLISLISPVPASSFLEQYSRLDAENQIMVEKGDFIMAQGSNAQETKGAIETLDASADKIDWMRREEERAAERREDIRTGALMAIFGGDRRMAQRFVSLPEFTSIDTSGSEPVMIYDTTAIDQAVIAKLNDLHQEEIRRGLVLDPDGASYDQALENLRQRNPEHEAVISQLLESGGRVATRIQEPEIAASDARPDYDATAATLVSGLLSGIPNVTIIQGNGSYLSQDDNGRIPSVLFVNDAQAPTLIFPYRNSMQGSNAEYRAALSSMIQWMGDHGGLDVESEMARVLTPLASLADDAINSNLRYKFSQQAREWLAREGIVATGEQEDRLEAHSRAWSKVIMEGIAEAHSRLDSGVDRWFSPEQARRYLAVRNAAAGRPSSPSKAVSNQVAAEVLAHALTHPAAQRILALSLHEAPDVPSPSEAQSGRFGHPMTTGSAPTALAQITADFLASIPPGQSVVDERGVEVTSDGDEGFQMQALADFDEIARELGLDSHVDFSRMGLSPIFHDQIEWQNTILHNLLGRLQSTSSPEGLIPRPQEAQGLSEMEARQLLQQDTPQGWGAILDEMVADRDGQPATASDLMRVSGEIANRLRERYNSFRLSASDAWGFFRFNQGLGGDFNTSAYEEQRIAKGKIAILEELGYQFEEDEDGVRRATITDTPEEMEERARAAGRLRHSPSPVMKDGQFVLDEKGKRVIEHKTVFRHHADEFARETAEGQGLLDDLRNAAVSRHTAFRNLKLAFGKLANLRQRIGSALGRQAFRKALGDDAGSIALMEALPLVDSVWQDRDDLVRTIASNIVDDFDQNTLSLRWAIHGSGAGPGPLLQNAWEVSDRFLQPLETLGQDIRSAVETISRLEEGIRPSWARDDNSMTGGVPSWYRSKGTRELFRLRGSLERSVTSFNDLAASAARAVNRLFPDQVNVREWVIPTGPSLHQFVTDGSAASLISRITDQLGRLSSPNALRRMAENHIRRNVMDSLNRFDPSGGVHSRDLSWRAASSTMEISQEADLAIYDALTGSSSPDERMNAVARAVSRHLLPARDTARAVRSLLRTTLSRELREVRDKVGNGDAVVSDIIKLSEKVASLSKVNAVVAARVVMDTLRSAMEGRIAADYDSLHQAMTERANTEAAFNRRRQGVRVATTDGRVVVHFVGKPDDIEIIQRSLAEYGRAYSEDYLQLLASSRNQGASGSKSAQQQAANLTRIGATALSVIDGINYTVSGNVVGEADWQANMDAILNRLGIEKTPAGRAEKRAEMKWRADPIVALTQQDFDRQRKERISQLENLLKEPDVEQPAAVEPRAVSELDRASIERELASGPSPQRAEYLQRLLDRLDYLESEGFSIGQENPQPFATDERVTHEDIRAEIEHLKSRKFGTALGTSFRSYDPSVNARVASIHKSMMISPALGKPDPSIAKQLGIYDVFQAMSDELRQRILFLVDSHSRKAFSGLGVTIDPVTGRPSDDLHVRIGSALAGASAGTADTNAALDKVFKEAFATDWSNDVLDGLMAGYVPGSIFESGFKNDLTSRDAKARIVFSRNVRGFDATNRITSLADRGAFAHTGRGGYESQIGAIKQLVHEAYKKLSGDSFEKAANAYMALTIESHLLAKNTRQIALRAEDMLRMLDQAASGYASALREGSGSAASNVAQWLTEPTHKLLEDRKVFGELYKKFTPILEQLRDTENLDDALTQIRAMEPDSMEYFLTLKKVFSHVSSAYKGVMARQGIDTERYERRPIAVPSWQSFGKEWSDNRGRAPVSDLLDLERSSWLTGFHRFSNDESFDMLRVNGLSAPLMILDDMIYRMNVTPAYAVMQTLTGSARNVEGRLEQDVDQDGLLGHLADNWFGPGTRKSDLGRSASLASHELAARSIRNDLSRITPAGRVAGAMDQINMMGAASALNSLSQIWRQSVFGSLAYAALDGGLKPNLGYLPQLARYMGSKLSSRFRGQASADASYAARVDRFVARHSPYIFMRGADGNTVVARDISKMKPARRNVAPGRVSGKARPVLDAVRWLPGKAWDASNMLAEKALEWEIARPEKVVARNIFMHRLLKEYNRSQVNAGFSPIDMDTLIDKGDVLGVTPFQMQRASIAVSDIMGPSDPSQRAKIVQPAETIRGSLKRGVAIMFASQAIGMAANSRAGWHMMWNGTDMATKGAGAFLVGTTLAQNLMFFYFRYNMTVHLASLALASLGGWDDRKREDWVKARFGIHDGDTDAERRKRVEFWVSMMIGGSSRPIGWDDRSDSFTESKHDEDMKRAYSQIAVGTMQQLPLIGLIGTTPLVDDLILTPIAERALLSSVPGKIPEYERAGLIVGEGPEGNAAEKAAYDITRFYLDEIGGRSTLLIGLTNLLEPLILASEAEGDLSGWDMTKLIGAGFPTLPREVSALLQQDAEQHADIQRWHSHWVPGR